MVSGGYTRLVNKQISFTTVNAINKATISSSNGDKHSRQLRNDSSLETLNKPFDSNNNNNGGGYLASRGSSIVGIDNGKSPFIGSPGKMFAKE